MVTTTATAWTGWIIDSTTTTSTSVTACEWYTWCDDSTTTSGSNDTWPTWNYGGYVPYVKPRELTADELAAREERRKRQEEEAKQREAARLAAEQRAAALLVAHLDEEQRRTYEADRHFFVISADGERFEIDCRARHRNVYLLNDAGKRIEGFCIYQTGPTPLADNHLAQKLMLEAAPQEFKRIANRWAMAA